MNKNSQTNTTAIDANTKLYAAFIQIPLDIEGSNLQKTGWIPSEQDRKFMDDDNYELAKKEAEEKNAKVMFTNVILQWDSCDCGDGYGCSHGSYVYEILIKNEDKTHKIDMEEDFICFQNNGFYGCLPIATSTIFDFYRMCQLTEIQIELSDYAKSLLSGI